MTMARNSSQGYSKGGEWKGILSMVILLLISTLNVNISGHTIGFIFLPLIGVCLWPRTDKAVVSIVAVLISGLLLDLLSAGPLGLWALIFLSVFAVSQPHMRPNEFRLNMAFIQCLGFLIFAVIVSYLLGWFAMERRPDITALLFQALAYVILFPFIYGLRHLGGHLLSDSNSRSL